MNSKKSEKSFRKFIALVLSVLFITSLPIKVFANFQPTVHTKEVNAEGKNSCTVIFLVESFEGYEVTDRGLVYSSTTSAPTLGHADVYTKSYGFGVGWATTEITGLNLGMNYYIRAYATNRVGTSYGETKLFSTSAMGTIPIVSTHSVALRTNFTADLEIEVEDTGGSAILERGVVYSTTDAMPIYGASNCYSHSIGGTVGTATATVHNLRANTKYFARAFAKNSVGIAYGNVKTFTTKNIEKDIPNIYIEQVYEQGKDSAKVIMYINDKYDSLIVERGVLFSQKNTNPTYNGIDVFSRSTNNFKGEETMHLQKLNPESRYYIRAYAIVDRDIIYSDVENFMTRKSDEIVKTIEVTNISTANATVSGTVLNAGGFNLIEKGFVYSTERNPTISDQVVYVSDDFTNDFSATITDLNADRDYYIRAFMQTENDISYGKTIEFRTERGNVYGTTLVYIKTDGSEVSRFRVITGRFAVLTKYNLARIPKNYILFDKNWTYTVDEERTVFVKIRSSNYEEQPFMVGTSNYRFEPDRAITRAEVAEMIYALKPSETGVNPRTFSDVNLFHYSKNAIDYVSANQFMMGDPNGKFRPDDTIKRGELATVLCNVYRLMEQKPVSFLDMVNSGHWSYMFVAKATTAGMISGYLDNTFRPERTTTRAEALSLFYNAEKRSGEHLSQISFTDVSLDHWAYIMIMNSAIAKP